jgi:hypothetical protein
MTASKEIPMNITTEYQKQLQNFVIQYSRHQGRAVTPAQVETDPKLMRLFCMCLVKQTMLSDLETQEVKSLTAPENPVSTQGKALKSITDSGKRMKQVELVHAYIRANPGKTREEIGEALHIRTSSVSGRVKELKDEGKVIVVGTRIGSGGVEVETYAAPRNALI